MSLSFLPWPIYLLVTISAGLTVIHHAFKNRTIFPKSLTSGLVILGIGSSLLGIKKFIFELNLYSNYIWIIEKSILVSIIGIPLILFGIYLKSKEDDNKRKAILRLYVVALIFFTVLGSAIVYFIYQI